MVSLKMFQINHSKALIIAYLDLRSGLKFKNFIFNVTDISNQTNIGKTVVRQYMKELVAEGVLNKKGKALYKLNRQKMKELYYQVSESDAEESEIDANLSESEAATLESGISESDFNVSESDTDTSETDANVSESDTKVSESDTIHSSNLDSRKLHSSELHTSRLDSSGAGTLQASESVSSFSSSAQPPVKRKLSEQEMEQAFPNIFQKGCVAPPKKTLAEQFDEFFPKHSGQAAPEAIEKSPAVSGAAPEPLEKESLSISGQPASKRPGHGHQTTPDGCSIAPRTGSNIPSASMTVPDPDEESRCWKRTQIAGLRYTKWLMEGKPGLWPPPDLEEQIAGIF
jgi:hypothetical protein